MAVIDLQNDYNNGIDQFPNSLTEAYNVMANYTPKTTVNKETQGSVYSLAMSFYQDRVPVPGSNGLLFPHITCLKCGRNGHYANYCPPVSNSSVNEADGYSSDEESLHFAFFQHQFTQIVDGQERYSGLQPSWVLLDTQSTDDIFHNRRLVHNIHKVEGPSLSLKSNGGNILTTDLQAEVTGYGPVWFSQHSIANILSFANVRKKFRITVDTGPNDPAPTIIVHRPCGTTMRFTELKTGLYVYDAAGSTSDSALSTVGSNHSNASLHHYSLVNTVDDNKEGFTSRQINLQNKLCHFIGGWDVPHSKISIGTWI